MPNTILPPSQVHTFLIDFEVDGIDAKTANISEGCVRSNKKGHKTPYQVRYMAKPQRANYDGPFTKPIPKNRRRTAFNDAIQGLFNHVHNETRDTGKAVMMGYNVKGWDEVVLKENCKRFKVDQPENWSWFDVAIVAHKLGFPMGTTQQQLEWALKLEDLPANRHRAHADVRVLHKIWQKLLVNIADDQARLDEIKTAMQQQNAESLVADIIKKYNPDVVPNENQINLIKQIKAAEKARKIPLVVVFDLETTGLQQENNKEKAEHHNEPVHIVEFAARIISPYSDQEISFQELVRPPEEVCIPTEASSVHHITDEMVQNAPAFDEVWKKFITWLKTSITFQKAMESLAETEDGSPVELQVTLVGFNSSSYDIPILEQTLYLHGVDLKRELSKKVKTQWDAIHFVRSWYGGIKDPDLKPKNFTLQGIREFLKIPENNAHRALEDVETTIAILEKLSEGIQVDEIVKKSVEKGHPGITAKNLLAAAIANLKEGLDADSALFKAQSEVDVPEERKEKKFQYRRTTKKIEPEEGSLEVATLSCGMSLSLENVVEAVDYLDADSGIEQELHTKRRREENQEECVDKRPRKHRKKVSKRKVYI